MPSGGKRIGAGRKALEERKTGGAVRATAADYDKAQPRALKALLEALGATIRVQALIGQDVNGKPIYEAQEAPDHQVRIRAAQIIANKRIPDVARQEVTGKDGEKLDIGVIYYPQKVQEGA